MNRIILVYNQNTSLEVIIKAIKDCVLYSLVIVKIIPENALDLVLTMYEKLLNLHPNILFNIELSEQSPLLINDGNLPLFIDYFYYSDNLLNLEKINHLKKHSQRIDFNLIYSPGIEMPSDLSLFDNIDIYTPVISSSFLVFYQKNQRNELIQKNIEQQFITNSPFLTQIDMPTILKWENSQYHFYLFGVCRDYKTTIVYNTVPTPFISLNKIKSYLFKINNTLCSECTLQNYCFSQGFWLFSNQIIINNKCKYYENQ